MMSEFGDKRKSLLENMKEGDHIMVKMTDQEVFALITLLAFAGSTAKYAGEQELMKGTPQAAERLKSYALNAETLLTRLYDTLEFGDRPPMDQLN